MNRWFTALFISLEIGRCDPAKLIIDQNTNHDFDCSCWNWLLHIRSSKPRGVQIVSLCSSSGRENGARCSNDHVVNNSYTLVLPLTCEWAISSAPLPKTQRYHPTQQSFSIGLAEIKYSSQIVSLQERMNHCCASYIDWAWPNSPAFEFTGCLLRVSAYV